MSSRAQLVSNDTQKRRGLEPWVTHITHCALTPCQEVPSIRRHIYTRDHIWKYGMYVTIPGKMVARMVHRLRQRSVASWRCHSHMTFTFSRVTMHYFGIDITEKQSQVNTAGRYTQLHARLGTLSMGELLWRPCRVKGFNSISLGDSEMSHRSGLSGEEGALDYKV